MSLFVLPPSLAPAHPRLPRRPLREAALTDSTPPLTTRRVSCNARCSSLSSHILASTINLSLCDVEHPVEASCCSDRLLDDISINVGRGQRIALLGVPGSGAKALLRCLRQASIPCRGRVLISGSIALLDAPLVEDFQPAVTRLPRSLATYGSVVVATHDPQLADRCERVLVMRRGRIIDDIR